GAAPTPPTRQRAARPAARRRPPPAPAAPPRAQGWGPPPPAEAPGKTPSLPPPGGGGGPNPRPSVIERGRRFSTRRRGDAEGKMSIGRTLDNITGGIVDASFKLHVALGPGLLESVYETILARDLQRRGLQVERQRMIS